MSPKKSDPGKVFTCDVCQKSFGQRQTLKRHMQNHEEAKYACKTCRKPFVRIDVLVKHEKSCCKVPTDGKKCRLCGTKFTQKCHLTRHEKKCKIKKKVLEMRAKSKEYNEKIQNGRIVYQILQEESDIYEAALGAWDKDCLNLYQQTCVDMDTNEDVLKPWQKQVIDFINQATDRHVFWVIGARGNEGKSWLQKYMERQFGTRRVFKGELNAKNSDVAYILSKQTLTCKDIFLFNLPRSDNSCAYGIIENLKDGHFFNRKYVSQQLKVKTPNTVIVFSNSPPKTHQLSKDRWRIYEIQNDLLQSYRNRDFLDKL